MRTRFYDITATMRPGMPTYDGEPGPTLTPLQQLDRGDPANVTVVQFGSHTGTHIDAPAHFLPDAEDVTRLPLDVLIGPAIVLDVGEADEVTADILEAADLPGAPARLLLKTRNSRFWAEDRFRTDFVYLTPDGAEWLMRRGVRLVGIDYLSIERYRAEGHQVHKMLLAARVVIVEGLNLRGVPPGAYQLACLPLKLEGAEGAPARAVLWR